MGARGNVVRHLLWLSLILGSLWLALGTDRSVRAAPPAAPTAGPAPAPPTMGPVSRPLDDPYARIQPPLGDEILENGAATYIVVLAEQADTRNTLTDWVEKGQFVYERLTSRAVSSQGSLLTYLDGQRQAGHVESYEALWIINAIVVTSDVEVLSYLANHPAVGTIWANGRVRALGQTAAMPGPRRAQPALPPEHNITALGAPRIWAQGTRGQGVVVATLDTGAEATHPALERKYRGWNNGNPLHDYNWWDAVQGRQAAGPYDDNGHGSHTMGIVLGSEADNTNQIGMAPGARWIAVKMLDDLGVGTDAQALRAMQWVLAPTRVDGSAPRPDLRPQVVSNSWGAVCADAVTRGAVVAWLDAGIFASFAGGDNGVLTAPAAFPEAFAVGAVDDRTGYVASFNGAGPSCYDGSIRPQVLAPGVDIRSSLGQHYSTGWRGTSMAQAHVAGAAALILAARPDLSVSQVRHALTSTAAFAGYMGARPNNIYGWGLVDAYAAYQAVRPPTPPPSPTTAPSSTPTTEPTPVPPLPTPPEPNCTIQFDDVPPGHWARGFVQWFYCRGYVAGYGNNRFGPDQFTTRAQFTKLLVLSHDWPVVTPARPSFVDVPRSLWAYGYIETARARGVISGYMDGTFVPAGNVTRAQLAKMLVQSQGWTPVQPVAPTFTDVGPDHWAYIWIETIIEHQVASGYSDRTFRPRQSVTRAQLSKMLYRALVQP
jgi:subtilisin family serine protease